MRDARSYSGGLVLLSTLLAAGCSRSDPALQVAVDAQLAVDSATAPLSLDVSATRGVIRLAGEVTSREQQRRALDLARSVKGVKAVVDEMHLGDAAVATTVKQMLAADPVVGKVAIEVDSSNGHVRLMSDQTNKDERTRAIEIAKKVDGVTTVEDRMR